MTAARTQFDANIAQARDLVGIAVAIDAATTPALDTSDLLRFALVSLVSALDQYVHEVVRELMVQTALGLRVATDAFGRFNVSTDVALRAGQGDPPATWMDEEVRRQHGHLSFQHPDKIADAVRLIWDQPLWNTLAPGLGVTPVQVKQELLLVVTRRNQIAHEADRDPTPPHGRWPILREDVEGALDLIESIVSTLDQSL